MIFFCFFCGIVKLICKLRHTFFIKIYVPRQANLLILRSAATPTPLPLPNDKLNFNHYINNIRKSASNQLNALLRIKYLARFEEREVLVNAFIISNFNYCSLVWNFSIAASANMKNYRKEFYVS